MFKNLNQAVVATNGLPFIVKSRPTLSQRSKTVTIALLSIAGVVFAIGAGLGYLLFSEIAIAKNAVVNLQAQAGSSSQIARRYQSTERAYNATTSQLSFLEPSDAQNQFVPTLLQQLQSLAQSTDLQVISVKPEQLASLSQKATAPVAAAVPASGDSAAPPSGSASVKTAPPAYDTLPVQIEVDGNYRQIMAFVYALPRFPKILCLKNLSLSPKGVAAGSAGAPAGNEPQLSAKLTIDAYVFAPPSAAAPAVSAADAGNGGAPTFRSQFKVKST